MGNFNDNFECELVVIGLLDKEMDNSFEITMKLKTLSAFANPTRMRAKVLTQKHCANK